MTKKHIQILDNDVTFLQDISFYNQRLTSVFKIGHLYNSQVNFKGITK